MKNILCSILVLFFLYNTYAQLSNVAIDKPSVIKLSSLNAYHTTKIQTQELDTFFNNTSAGEDSNNLSNADIFVDELRTKVFYNSSSKIIFCNSIPVLYTNGSMVDAYAQNQIILNPGFIVDSGSVFTAEIRTNKFDTTPNSSRQITSLNNKFDEVKNRNNFFIYPNPASTFLMVDNIYKLPFIYIIYDMNGNVIQSNSVAAIEKQTIDIKVLTKGFYLIEFRNEKNNQIYKFVKE